MIVDLPQDLAHQSIAELDNLTFSATQHGALFRRYSALEPSAGRDMELASYLADGHVPAEIVQQQLAALRTFTRDEAIELARTRLNWDHASVVVLRASEGKTANATRPIIEQAAEPRERHRSDVAVDAARRPAVLDALPRVAGMRTRHLRNGLDVVLIPSPAVPTLDIRLVFRSGTGDEPQNKRGVATLAAHALEWNLTYVKDRLLFERAGGLESVDVETDRTTFSVSGMDNQLDYLLVGLRRRVREGLYDLGIVSFLKRVNRARQRRDEWLAPTDAWRASLYGQDHPYVRAGLLRAADDGVTRSDADAFRAAHYRPDNATLIVSGHFDPAVVDRWVDYLFADWRGHATARSAPRASLRPDSLASEGRSSQVSLSIAFPVTSTDRAAQLVTVEMLSQMAGDVRLDLGASYGTSARLAEQRLSTLYILSGSIDASRAAIAIKLLADDIARLRGDPELAARVFVRARGRVLARLASLADSAPAAADQIEHDVAVGRAPLSDLGLAAAVRDLTIERISPSLVDIDLSRAAVWMHGPPDVVGRGFEILGRKPTRMAFDPATRTVEQDDGSSDDIVLQPYVDNVPRQLADPLTTRSTPFRFIYALALGASFATIEHVTAAKRMSDSYTGAAATVEVGYRRHGPIRFGIRGDAAALAGSADTLAMFDVAPFVQSPLAAPFWLGAFAGVHGEHDMSSRIGAVFGGELGLDLIPVKHHWLGLFGQYAFIMNGDSHHGALTFGLAYRH
ncbi:MAG TPA: insulinase family protein [Kofleriaceae bacterium]|nr:insulinase family protein [Kofleriaceae bacterium]